jgi:hypothetical protein
MGERKREGFKSGAMVDGYVRTRQVVVVKAGRVVAEKGGSMVGLRER